MKAYYLFVDTETSGRPVKWGLPYSDKENWPSMLQLAWYIYDSEGVLLKSENYYLKNSYAEIAPEAYQIHGIDHMLLNQAGNCILWRC